MVKEGYKQTEVGVIPVDWEVVSLEDVTTKIGSGKTPTGGKTRYKSKGLAFVRSQNIGWGRMILDDVVYIDKETHNEFVNSEIEEGDTFLNITGASIGRSAVALPDVYGGNVNQHVCIVRPIEQLDSVLLSAFLNSKSGQQQIDSFQAGGNREGLNFKQVRSIQLPLPPTLTEQRAIATALSDTDALLASLAALIGKKEAFKWGMMEGLLSGEGRLAGFSSAAASGVEGEWEETTIGASCLVEMGQSPSSIYYNESGIGLPLIQGNADIKNRRSIIRNYSSFSPKTCSAGDILISVRAPVGEIAIASYNSCLGRGVAALKNSECSSFLYQLMIHEENKWAKFSKGSTFDSITSEQVREFEISLPPLPEQRAIARVLSDLDAELAALRARREKLRRVKAGMMEVLLSGAVRLV